MVYPICKIEWIPAGKRKNGRERCTIGKILHITFKRETNPSYGIWEAEKLYFPSEKVLLTSDCRWGPEEHIERC